MVNITTIFPQLTADSEWGFFFSILEWILKRLPTFRGKLNTAASSGNSLPIIFISVPCNSP